MLAQVITENGVKKLKPLTADAGAGAPVGTIIVVCSNRVPSNYLPLGTQYDTSLYPILYALLGTDTTPTASALGLPTLTSGQYVIKATSGLTEGQQDDVANIINGERSYSTEEVNTGKKWIDGKPIYRKTVQITVSEGNHDFNHGIANVDYVTKMEGISKHKTTDIFRSIPFSYYGSSLWTCNVYATRTAITLECGSAYASEHSIAYITLEYTKTT